VALCDSRRILMLLLLGTACCDPCVNELRSTDAHIGAQCTCIPLSTFYLHCQFTCHSRNSSCIALQSSFLFTIFTENKCKNKRSNIIFSIVVLRSSEREQLLLSSTIFALINRISPKLLRTYFAHRSDFGLRYSGTLFITLPSESRSPIRNTLSTSSPEIISLLPIVTCLRYGIPPFVRSFTPHDLKVAIPMTNILVKVIQLGQPVSVLEVHMTTDASLKLEGSQLEGLSASQYDFASVTLRLKERLSGASYICLVATLH
jgi:hypothetical protein